MPFSAPAPSCVLALLSLSLVGLAGSSPASAAGAGEPVLVDRVVAVVDEDPILLSDIERVLGLRLVEAEPGESETALRRRVLDGLIEQRLRLHEIGRFGFEDASFEDVETQFAALRGQFADDAALAVELERLGLTENDVRQLLSRQLAVLGYVEERLGPRVLVDADEIRRYYDEELAPRMAAESAPLPPIDEVREAIRAVLRERELNLEIERWTAELRAAADVVDLFDAPERPLPPERFALPATH